MADHATTEPVTGRYTQTAIVLHWVIAALIVVNFAFIWFVDDLPQGWARAGVNTHKSIGLTVLGLVLLRVLWRATHRPPALPSQYPAWEKLAAHSAHAVLYALIFLIPLTGYIHDSAWKNAPANPMRLFGLIPFPRIGFIESMEPAQKEAVHSQFFAYHYWLSWVLFALFVVHVAAALKHQYVDRERELQRMGVG